MNDEYNWDSMDSASYEELWLLQREDAMISEGREDYSGYFREDYV